MTNTSQPPEIWTGQTLHFVCLAVLLFVVWVVWGKMGEPFPVAFFTAVAIPIVHQVFVWLAWRLELRSSAISETVGFPVYLACFFSLLVGRVAAVLVLAWLDTGSLQLPALPRILVVVALSPAWLYTVYCVQRYFGIVRAAGADHFSPRYRQMALVRDGVFRISSNAMYLFGFIVLWVIGVGFNSAAVLVVAVFSHVYIWVHYFATEKPDMEFLYPATE